MLISKCLSHYSKLYINIIRDYCAYLQVKMQFSFNFNGLWNTLLFLLGPWIGCAIKTTRRMRDEMLHHSFFFITVSLTTEALIMAWNTVYFMV